MVRNKSDAGFEAIFFLSEHRVFRQMLKSEFEALLDGYVGLSDMADTEAHVVHVFLSPQLKITALVFFTIYFDEDGRADPEWNLPVEKMAAKGGSGPDLGGGPIRLACRSQCPINWHQTELWDPSMKAGANDFQAIRKAVDENRLGFEVVAPKPEKETPPPARAPSKKKSAPPPVLDEEEIPLLSADAEEEDSAPLDDEVEVSRDNPEHRTKIARTLKAQRLRIKTLENYKNDELAEQAREFRISAQQSKHQLQELEQSLERFKLHKEQLEKKLSDRNEQFLALQDRMADQSTLVAELQKKLRGTENIEQEREEATTLRAELLIVKEQLDKRNEDLKARDEVLDQLRSELEDLKESYDELRNEGSLFEKLHELDVVFMAYHPGAGHVTIPFVDIKRYANNPTGYVASKCYVKEEDYLHWLEHYESPVCQHRTASGDVCGTPLSVVHAPSEFKPEYSDRCVVHRKKF
ncbi:MAG: DNA repair ATPase [Hahellaceae bacterium]|nr:DNA repair ATPase [Hahellaceae bacterium]